jgi:hypothetical protein
MDRDTGPNSPGASTGASATGAPPQRLAVAGRQGQPGLSADPRLTAWIRRAVIALVAGVGIAIPFGWRFGLTAAAAVAILDTIIQSRSMAMIPAQARATQAQRKTRKKLSGLRTSGYVALNALAIPGSDQVIDHLVIGPSGVYAVDSEHWDRRLPVRVTGATGKGVLYHGPYSQADRLAHARWEAGEATRLLTAELGEQVSVRPAMAIYGPEIKWGVATLRGVEVFSGSRVRKYFRNQDKITRGDHLDEEEIGMIYAAAERVLPPAQ